MLTSWILVLHLIGQYRAPIVIEDITSELNCRVMGDDIQEKSQGEIKHYSCTQKNPMIVSEKLPGEK